MFNIPLSLAPNTLIVVGCIIEICGVLLFFSTFCHVCHSLFDDEAKIFVIARKWSGVGMQLIAVVVILCACALAEAWLWFIFVVIILVPILTFSAYDVCSDWDDVDESALTHSIYFDEIYSHNDSRLTTSTLNYQSFNSTEGSTCTNPRCLDSLTLGRQDIAHGCSRMNLDSCGKNEELNADFELDKGNCPKKCTSANAYFDFSSVYPDKFEEILDNGSFFFGGDVDDLLMEFEPFASQTNSQNSGDSTITNS